MRKYTRVDVGWSGGGDISGKQHGVRSGQAGHWLSARRWPGKVRMLKSIAAVLTGLIVWVIVATIGNVLLRALWPGYAEVERALTFTLAMQLARLVLGALSSLCAGFAAARIAQSNRRAVMVLGVLLIIAFIPIHYNLWDKFPLWYHLTFLASLFPLTLLGAQRVRRRSVDRQAGTT